MSQYNIYTQEVIDLLKQKGLDYSTHKEIIKQKMFKEGIYRGNHDCKVYFNDDNVKALKIIQKDEYEQHMDEEKPLKKESLGYAGGG